MKVEGERAAKAAEQPIGKPSIRPLVILIAAPVTGALLWILLVSLAPLFLK